MYVVLCFCHQDLVRVKCYDRVITRFKIMRVFVPEFSWIRQLIPSGRQFPLFLQKLSNVESWCQRHQPQLRPNEFPSAFEAYIQAYVALQMLPTKFEKRFLKRFTELLMIDTLANKSSAILLTSWA